VKEFGGAGLRYYNEVDSTNEEARRLAESGIEGPLWLLADRQTRGRGRRGREWLSPTGNLYATLLLRPEHGIARCAELSFAAALAVSELVALQAPQADVRVKWPNDVLADERKIAGILLESASNNGIRPDWLAIGFGLNLKSHPEEVNYPATSLLELGAKAPPPREALASLAEAFAKWYGLWLERGFVPVRDAWLARAARVGMRIRARIADRETSGVFEGIDETGALLLRESANRLRTISAGEVYF
jgi:BirA family biotin operon repressor/biotin-[acetyl-CoA-carboxylase] ligase